MSQMSAREVEEQYHRLAAGHRYARALQLVTEHFNLFPLMPKGSFIFGG